MSAAGVVEALDVFEHRVRQLDSGVLALPVQQINLHAAPKGLDDGVIVGVTNSAQGWQEPCLLGAPGECPRGELTRFNRSLQHRCFGRTVAARRIPLREFSI